jgi:hypothetical protein
MTNNLLERPQGPTLWAFIAGFAAASLLTLAAAVGTSMLHRQTPEQAKAFEAPVAQR